MLSSFFIVSTIHSQTVLNVFPQGKDKFFTGLCHVTSWVPLHAHKTNLNNRRNQSGIWPYLFHTGVRLWCYRKWGVCVNLHIKIFFLISSKKWGYLERETILHIVWQRVISEVNIISRLLWEMARIALCRHSYTALIFEATGRCHQTVNLEECLC